MEADEDPGELGLTLIQSFRSLKETFLAVDPNENLTVSIVLHRSQLHRSVLNMPFMVFTTS